MSTAKISNINVINHVVYIQYDNIYKLSYFLHNLYAILHIYSLYNIMNNIIYIYIIL